jgi:hypothetical protein
MSWRSVVALLLLAFAGGVVAFAWLNSDGQMPWDEQKAPIADALEAVEESAASSAIALPTPTIIQPAASQAEAALLVLNARQAMEAGKPLGDLANRLQVTFGQNQPQAMTTILSAARRPVSNATLLDGFDAIAPRLLEPGGTAWDRGRYELAHLFVIRRGDAEPSAITQRIKRTREAIIAGDIAIAAKTVRAMPGADQARIWLLDANRAIAVHQAFDALSQSAMTLATSTPVATMPEPAISLPQSTAPE